MERLIVLFLCLAVNPVGLSAESSWCAGRAVRERGGSTSSDRPVLLLPRQRVWEGGTSGSLRSHLLLVRLPPTNRLLCTVQLRSNRRGRFTYANDMEMTQTRGHADRFRFGSWVKSQARAGCGHSAGILVRYIIWMMMRDSRHVSKRSGSGQVSSQQFQEQVWWLMRVFAQGHFSRV